MQAPAQSAPAGAEATPLAAVVARLAVRLAAVINAALQQLIRQLEVPNAVTTLQKLGQIAPFAIAPGTVGSTARL